MSSPGKELSDRKLILVGMLKSGNYSIFSIGTYGFVKHKGKLPTIIVMYQKVIKPAKTY